MSSLTGIIEVKLILSTFFLFPGRSMGHTLLFAVGAWAAA
jgi:hypothetical protein